VRDLADAQNPYAGRYSAWDEWIIKNAPGSSAQDLYAWHRGDAPRGYTVLITAVDKEGFVIPAVDYVRAKLDPNSEISKSSCSYRLEAGGQIDRAMLDAYRVAVAKSKAAWLPVVPGWLAQAPPKLAQFYQGEVLTFGEPGSGAGVWEDSLASVLGPSGKDVWRRYTLAGELIAETEPGGQWWQLFFPNFADVLNSLGGQDQVSYFAYQGFVVFSNKASQKVMAVYDYSGVEQPKDTDFFSSGYEDPMFQPLAGGELPWIYAGQQALAEPGAG
jgi:hypothetical protein